MKCQELKTNLINGQFAHNKNTQLDANLVEL